MVGETPPPASDSFNEFDASLIITIDLAPTVYSIAQNDK